ncbi:MAG: family N-acetyltransferase [Mucilaginibacter sp.]|jgi:RimJ/RimL family protein N-acetyltransferase|nr:family N-acetyltransferase [Mucilaginibacter sp.]MDB5018016.1 family N-acetyltransferase [Mucilaginibacter sp.]MDB5140173.1 family N-acetyltransferase [Mucilaginibacter sp.]
MEQVTVRKARLDDLEVLFDFEKEIIRTERPFDSTLKEGDIHYYDLEYMVGATDVEVVVAEIGTEVIGSGYARIENSKIYNKHQKHAYLGFMYVKTEHRGKGINYKVIEALKNWSLLNGITEFRLEVYDENLRAIKAYEKIGFAKLLVQMRMGL